MKNTPEKIYDSAAVREARGAVARALSAYDRKTGSGGYDYIRAVAILEATEKLAAKGEPVVRLVNCARKKAH